MKTFPKDVYAKLRVPTNATQEEIKKAFRRRSMECHPDVARYPGAEEEFKALNAAYEVLSDETLRAQYDRTNNILKSAPNTRPHYRAQPEPRSTSTHQHNPYNAYNDHARSAQQDSWGSWSYRKPKQKQSQAAHEAQMAAAMAAKAARVEKEAREKAQHVYITREQAQQGTIHKVWLGANQLSLRIPSGIANGTLLRIKGATRNYYFRVSFQG